MKAYEDLTREEREVRLQRACGVLFIAYVFLVIAYVILLAVLL